MYVFALHHRCMEPDQYEALNMADWAFYVVPIQTLRDAGSRAA